MPDEAATAYWRTNKPQLGAGDQPKHATTESRTFESLNRAVIFVMEDLESSRRSGAQIVTASHLTIHPPVMEQIYASLKSK
jgi:hypothetical protein